MIAPSQIRSHIESLTVATTDTAEPERLRLCLRVLWRQAVEAALQSVLDLTAEAATSRDANLSSRIVAFPTGALPEGAAPHVTDLTLAAAVVAEELRVQGYRAQVKPPGDRQAEPTLEIIW